MDISVFGTGEVGSAVAAKLHALGHDTVLGSRHPGSDRDGIPVLTHTDAAAHGDWIGNAMARTRCQCWCWCRSIWASYWRYRNWPHLWFHSGAGRNPP